MNDVAAAWMMTSMVTAPIWVALVQTASTLPVFVLGLPSGAIADNLDRKRYYLATQLWVACTSAVLSLVVFMGWMTPLALLLLTFANGVGLAMRWPIFSSVVPSLVSRGQVPAALALNAVSMNISRIAGPVVAGAVIALAGGAWVFLLNAVMSLVAVLVVIRWKNDYAPHPLGRERMLSAMRVGLQYVSQSSQLKGMLLRTSIYFFHSTALLALLPVHARDLPRGGAWAFTLLLASMGTGAVLMMLWLPRLRAHLERDRLLSFAGVCLLGAMLTVACSSLVWVSAAAMLVAGAAWISTTNTLSISMQHGLPDWVRARGMSVYQMAIMGASASGAAVWGQVATWGTVPMSMASAALSGFVALQVASRLMPDKGGLDDLTPRRLSWTPKTATLPTQGHVVIMIEYIIDPSREVEFQTIMRDESRRNRLRNGALSWELLHDLNAPGRFLEVIVDESWTEHLRRIDRTTMADDALRGRRTAFHLGPNPPRVSR
ncbi:MFS family permease [Hydrogenophaga laconesensis]|uniref:MFS family permease n=2 Tax=Hydrogenophaga laconesensis TaxID=1805971 RepID=A0ABU1V829_9BURK|nr:MFS family permease [Hydrogenophaga laconesensis]